LQLLLAAALVGCVFGLSALGVWQLERRTWKLALIDRVETRIHAAPGPLPAAASWPVINAADEYRRIRVTGTFLNERETLVKAVTDLGSGFWVVTPLRTAEGPTVLVNRGFVPPERRDPATRREGNPERMVSVTGLLRMTEPKGAFLRTNDPDANRWYSRDVAAIAAKLGLDGVAPFFIDAGGEPNPGGYPVGGLTVVRFPNNHLIYALTWFALAFMLAGALLFVARDRWRFRGLGSAESPVREPAGGARTFSRKTGSDAEPIIESA
jgi:surfeit locus 1 family protein